MPRSLLPPSPPSLAERAGWVQATAGVPELLEVPRTASTHYLTHGLFRYVGKLPPPLVAYFIDRYTNRGDIVLDPMCGGGTTAIEASASGRPSTNFDLNPVARLITAAMTTPMAEGAIEDFAARVIGTYQPTPPPAALTDYFSNDTYGLLSHGLYEAQSLVEKSLLLSIARPASFANTKKINTVVDPNKEPRRATDLLRKAAATYADSYAEFASCAPAPTEVGSGNASSLPLSDSSVAFTLLHPPYLTNTAFSEVTHLQLLLLGHEPRKLQDRELAYRGSYFHVPNGLKKYIIGWARIIREAARVVAPDGHVVVVVGDGSIDHIRIPIGTLSQEFADDAGLKLVERAEHRLNNQTGWTLSRRMSSQHVLVFRK